MGKTTSIKKNKPFEDSSYELDGIKYSFALEHQELLGYLDWRNFLNALQKVREIFKSNVGAVVDHFVDVTKMIKLN